MNDVVCRLSSSSLPAEMKKKLLIFIQHFSSSPSHFSFDEINILPTFCIHSVLRSLLVLSVEKRMKSSLPSTFKHHFLALSRLMTLEIVLEQSLFVACLPLDIFPLCLLCSSSNAKATQCFRFILVSITRSHSHSQAFVNYPRHHSFLALRE